MVIKTDKSAFSEVIESSLQTWTGQSWDWDTFPTYGSLTTIITPKRTWFGLVYQVYTGSTDPGRTPFAYKKTEQELLAEQPQIFEFLKTTFSCLALGFMEQERIFYQVPPEPPKIHAFIHKSSVLLSKQFFASSAYLPLIFASEQIKNKDELLLAMLREQKQLGILTEDKLYTIIQTISLLTGNDYRRIKIFSGRLGL
ncbi:MAG: hypothetical protein ACJAZS_000351 [Alteromonas naphthalenivorans]|jgi:hypothetical protein